MHLNIRSLQHKTAELEVLLQTCEFPKVICLSETWLSASLVLVSIPNYTFISSHRVLKRGGGVAMYLHNSIKFCLRAKSCNQVVQSNIDYIIVELLQYNITLCCICCLPKTNVIDIITVIDKLKFQSNHKSHFVFAGDFNINLLDETTSFFSDFVDDLHTLSLHPIINLPTRVTDTSATLIENFMCDYALLPLHSCVIKTDISDHYLICFFIEANDVADTVKVRSMANRH